MLKELYGRVVLLAGASSKVAPATAIKLADAGAQVVLHYYSNSKKIEILLEQIEKRGGNAIALQADLSKQKEAFSLIETILMHFERLDAVVNFVFPDEQFSPSLICDSDWDIHFEPVISAFRSNYYLLKESIPVMRKQQFGRIVYLSGVLAEVPLSCCSHYASIKAATNMFCKVLAKEEAKHNITCNIVAPGPVETDDKGTPPPSAKIWSEIEPNKLDQIPMGRFASQEDVASAVAFFILPSNSHITGQTLYVTGGEYMP